MNAFDECERFEKKYCCELEERDQCEYCKVFKMFHIRLWQQKIEPIISTKYCHPEMYRKDCQHCKDAPKLKLIQDNEKHNCDCGGRYQLRSKSTHNKTKKHQTYLNTTTTKTTS